jgi:hypothetical protein
MQAVALASHVIFLKQESVSQQPILDRATVSSILLQIIFLSRLHQPQRNKDGTALFINDTSQT